MVGSTSFTWLSVPHPSRSPFRLVPSGPVVLRMDGGGGAL